MDNETNETTNPDALASAIKEHSEAKQKYKMFRNYMVNELGITSDDIERWAKEAVTIDVRKKLETIDVVDIIKKETKAYARSMVSGSSNGWTYGANDKLMKALAQELTSKIWLKVAKDPNEPE